MTEIERLIIRLLGDASSYNNMLRTSTAATSRAATDMEAMLIRVETVGARVATGLTVAMMAFGASSAVAHAQFEAEMSKIIGLVGESRDQVNLWSQEVLAMAPAFGKAPEELAKGLYFITSSGIKGARALDTLNVAAQASAAGLGETMVMADALSSVMNAYAKSGMTAAHASDVMVAAVREGKIEADQLAPVIGRVVPLASALGVSFEEVAGAMAVMSRTGLSAAESAVSVNTVMSSLSNPTKQGRQALAEFGLTYNDLRNILRGPGGIVQLFRTLEQTFGNNTEAMQDVIPNIRGMRGVMNVLAQDASTVDQVMQSVRDSTGLTTKAFEVANQTTKQGWNQTLSEMKSLLVEVGGEMKGGFAVGMGIVRDGLKLLRDELKNTNEEGKATFAGMVVGAGILTLVLGPSLMLIGVAAAGAVYGVVKLGVALGELSQTFVVFPEGVSALQDFNEAIKESQRLQTILVERTKRDTGELMKEYSKLVGDDTKRSFLAEQIDQANRELAGHKHALNDAKNQAKEYDTYWNRMFNNKELEALNNNVKEEEQLVAAVTERVKELNAEMEKLPKETVKPAFTFMEDPAAIAARGDASEIMAKAWERINALGQDNAMVALDQVRATGMLNDAVYESAKAVLEYEQAQTKAHKLNEGIEKLTDNLKIQAATFRMTSEEASIFKMEIEGATDAQLSNARAYAEIIKAQKEHKKIMDTGKKTVEDVLKPQEKFEKGQKELQDQYEHGAISLETYYRAANKLWKETQKDYGIRLNVTGQEGFGFDSAEAYMMNLNSKMAFAGSALKPDLGANINMVQAEREHWNRIQAGQRGLPEFKRPEPGLQVNIPRPEQQKKTTDEEISDNVAALLDLARESLRSQGSNIVLQGAALNSA